jgi:hypothetical protein
MKHPLANEPIIKRSHQWIDARNLAMARLIARKIRRNPELFQEAVATLRHWKTIKPVPEAIREWDRIFENNSLEKILAIFTQDNEEGNRLRQSDPFCGILTHRERLEFLDRYEKS